MLALALTSALVPFFDFCRWSATGLVPCACGSIAMPLARCLQAAWSEDEVIRRQEALLAEEEEEEREEGERQAAKAEVRARWR